MYLSNCCYAPVIGEWSYFDQQEPRIGMCSRCKEMAEFYEDSEETDIDTYRRDLPGGV